jgi:hypothetical protein
MVVILNTGPKSDVCPDSVWKPVATRIGPSNGQFAIRLPPGDSVSPLERIDCVFGAPDLRKFFSLSANRLHTIARQKPPGGARIYPYHEARSRAATLRLWRGHPSVRGLLGIRRIALIELTAAKARALEYTLPPLLFFVGWIPEIDRRAGRSCVGLPSRYCLIHFA